MTISCAVSFVHPPAQSRLPAVETRLAPSPLHAAGDAASRASTAEPVSLRNALQRCRESIERERAQQVTAQPALDVAETVCGALHPGEVGGFGHFLEFAQNVRIADQLPRARLQEHQVFEQRVESAEKVF